MPSSCFRPKLKRNPRGSKGCRQPQREFLTQAACKRDTSGSRASNKSSQKMDGVWCFQEQVTRQEGGTVSLTGNKVFLIQTKWKWRKMTTGQQLQNDHSAAWSTPPKCHLRCFSFLPPWNLSPRVSSSKSVRAARYLRHPTQLLVISATGGDITIEQWKQPLFLLRCSWLSKAVSWNIHLQT